MGERDKHEYSKYLELISNDKQTKAELEKTSKALEDEIMRLKADLILAKDNEREGVLKRLGEKMKEHQTQEQEINNLKNRIIHYTQSHNRQREALNFLSPDNDYIN